MHAPLERCRQKRIDARRPSSLVAGWRSSYNEIRVSGAIGNIAPNDKLEGRDKQIFEEQDNKPEAAREAKEMKGGMAKPASARSRM